MTIFAYIRVSSSTHDQTTENQRKAIKDAGFAVDEFISEEGVSGSVNALERPAFNYLMSRAKEGDTCICTAIDRIGRTAIDILGIVEKFKKMGVRLRIMQLDGTDLTSSTGKLLVTLMAAMAELERNMIVERTNAGLARTKAQGTILGPPLTIAPATLKAMCEKKAEGVSYDKLTLEFNLPRNTIARNVKKWADNLEEYRKQFETRSVQYQKKQAIV